LSALFSHNRGFPRTHTLAHVSRSTENVFAVEFGIDSVRGDKALLSPRVPRVTWLAGGCCVVWEWACGESSFGDGPLRAAPAVVRDHDCALECGLRGRRGDGWEAAGEG
jgi:hypothetical protein